MEWTGKLQNVSRDWQSGQLHITFTVNEPSAVNEIESIKDCEKLSLSAKKFRRKRSQDANKYCWKLCDEIAKAVDSSRDEIYEEMIQKYGYLYQDEDGCVTITVKAEVDMRKIDGHWKFYKSNGKFTSYLKIKGSSEYNTAEMAHFIDGIVYEAKDLGIETMPPDELQRMVSQWQKG